MGSHPAGVGLARGGSLRGSMSSCRATNANPVVAVGVTCERKRASGPSGKNRVPKRTVRIPDRTWTAAGEKARAMGADRNQVINELLADWVRQ